MVMWQTLFFFKLKYINKIKFLLFFLYVHMDGKFLAQSLFRETFYTISTNFCSALSTRCLQSSQHPADTILAFFTRVCLPQPRFVVCILNAQQRGIPFGPAVSWNKPSASAPLPTWPKGRERTQIKWFHRQRSPQERIHSFVFPPSCSRQIYFKTIKWFHQSHSWQLVSLLIFETL